MDVWIVRHAEAVALGSAEAPTDESRYLTAKGVQDAQRLAVRMSQAPAWPTRILASPLVRTRQTAEFILQGLEKNQARLEFYDELKPGQNWKRFLKLQGRTIERTILVGHEPELSRMIAWLIGRDKVRIEMVKGAWACLRIKEWKRAAGILEALLPPELLL